MDHWLKIGKFKKKKKTKEDSFMLTTKQIKLQVLQQSNTN